LVRDPVGGHAFVNVLAMAEEREQQETRECEDPTDHAQAWRYASAVVIEQSLICL
jgi:hypothetical protein